MSDFLDTFAGQADRDVVVAATKAAARDVADPKNTILWGQAPRGIALNKVKRLTLFDGVGAQKALPANFDQFTNLVSLAVPLHLVAQLPGTLSTHLRTLIVLAGRAPSAALPKGLLLPKLETLLASEVKVSFDPAQVPGLRNLAVQAPKPKDLETVVELTKLEGLKLGPIPDAKIFKLVAKHPLRRLFLLRGGLPKLQGIETLPMLTHFGAKGMVKLADVRALDGLPLLGDLDFQFCPAVGDVSFLAKKKSLKKVRFWGCTDRKNTIRKAIPLLRAAKIEIDSDLDDEDEDDDD